MKTFKTTIFFIFSTLFLCSNLFGIIVLLNGPTCSGKSSIAREFSKLVDLSQWECVALDDIEDESTSDVGLVAALCNKVAQALRRNKNVICDTVFDNQTALDLFYSQFRQERILKVFVYCPLLTSLRYLQLRNERAGLLGKEEDRREILSLIHAFLSFYKASESYCCLGLFSMSDVEIVFQSNQAMELPRDIHGRLKSFLCNFCYDQQGDCHKLVYLTLTFGSYDIIVNSGRYSSQDCAQQILAEMKIRFQ